MYKSNPKKYKTVVEEILEDNPADIRILLDSLERDESNNDWMNQLTYEAFESRNINILRSFPLDDLTPELLNMVIDDKWQLSGRDTVPRIMNAIYDHFKDNPEYRIVLDKLCRYAYPLFTKLDPQTVTVKDTEHYIHQLLQYNDFSAVTTMLKSVPIINMAKVNPEVRDYLNNWVEKNTPESKFRYQ